MPPVDAAAVAPVATEPPAVITFEQRLAECVSLVRKASTNHDDSLLLRALRKTTLLRKNPAFTSQDLLKAYKKYFNKQRNSNDTFDSIQTLFATEMMDVESTTEAAAGGEVMPEVEIYLHHTALHFAKTRSTCPQQILAASAKVMMDRISSSSTTNNGGGTSMDVLRARALHTFAIIMEKSEDGEEGLLDYVLKAHRVACLTGELSLQAVTFNLVLRQLIQADQISEAEKFASKAKFPLESVSNNMQIRYLFYMGRIQALQLEYSESLGSLLHAIRKLPTSSSSAFKGLKLKLYKLATVVTLLTGDLPERAWFSQPEFRDALLPYFDLVKAVREGNLQLFQTVQAAHANQFTQDRVWSLIQRLHSSVIKTGLKSIGVSYSRISFQDVANKLELKQSEDALYLCAKAIRDGVLDASWIDADDCLCSAEPQDVYATTTEPTEAFQRRITYLLQAHNDAVKGLRFPAQKSSNPSGKEGSTFEFDEDELEELAESHMDED